MSGPKDRLHAFRNALTGMVFTFKTQRHMRFHLYVVLIVMIVGLFFNLGLRETLVLLFVISLVLVAEMFNSAIEATVDLVQPSYHPGAKFAKDIAAGAVLITTIVALVVGALLLLGPQRWEDLRLNLTSESPALPFMPRAMIGALMLFVIIVIGKGLGKSGTVLKGGLVSGHAAYGFFLAVGVIFLTNHLLASVLSVMLAAIVAQSRWEAKIHTMFELTLGATLGSLVGVIVFGSLPK